MIEPVALQDFFITFFSSALIILAGAGYASLFAWSKINPNFRIKIAAYISYAVLVLSVAELTRAAQFQGYWLIISLVIRLNLGQLFCRAKPSFIPQCNRLAFAFWRDDPCRIDSVSLGFINDWQG